MTESQRRRVPRGAVGELDTALAFLTFRREAVLIKWDGLDEQQLRWSPVGTGTNLLGLVAHLEVSERYWFDHHVAGRDLGRRWDFGMEVPESTRADEVAEAYRAAWEVGDGIVRDVADLDAATALPADEPLSLRWVLHHMIAETARHAGHADVLRELIDGVTGR